MIVIQGETGNGHYSISPRPVQMTSEPSALKTTQAPRSIASRGGRNISERPREIPNEFGIIIAIKDSFGFIQPYQGDEQIYFSLRELQSEMKVGDEVCFIKRANSKGFNAERVTILNQSSKQYVPNLIAYVVKDLTDFRSSLGQLEITESSYTSQFMINQQLARIYPSYGSLPHVPFFNEDIISTTSVKIPKKLIKGDEISFTLSYIMGTSYCKAENVQFIRCKRDRLLAEQIRKMLDAGVKREYGIIDTIKNKEYGFIRPVERPEQIYFRVDDVIREDIVLEENMEVEFFVIAESVKGKLSDRAFHLSVLPKGTVQFEETITVSVTGWITQEAINSPQEQPGTILLKDSIPSKDTKTMLSQIELWQRCVADDMILNIGDEISFDIQHYRPENLYFARSVQIKQYQSLSREYGSIYSIKENGFGFIRSYIRDIDLYFRTNEIRDGLTGQLISENDLYIDQTVCFNAILEENSNYRGAQGSNASKYKAIRIQTAYNDKNQTMSLDEIKYISIQSNIHGVILKDANKRENQPGQIKIVSDDWIRLQETVISKKCLHSQELINQITQFIDNPSISEIHMKYLTPGQRKAYHDVIDDLFQDNSFNTIRIHHETIDKSKEMSSNSHQDPNKSIVLKINKIMPSNESNLNKSIENHEIQTKKSKSKGIHSKAINEKDEDIVFYLKQDVDEKYGPLAKDLTVEFDLLIDKRTMKKIGKNVHLTDEPILEEFDDRNMMINHDMKEFKETGSLRYGVIDSIVGVKSGKFGFIRCIPSDEKLFWHSSSILKSYTAPSIAVSEMDVENSIHDGQVIAFELRRRGGMRCAVNINPLISNEIFSEQLIDGLNIVLIVENQIGVIIDPSLCPLLLKKLWDIRPLAYQRDLSIENTVQSPLGRDVQYFPCIGRDGIPIASSEVMMPTELSVGSLIICQAVCHWSTKRQPIRLIPIQSLASAISHYPAYSSMIPSLIVTKQQGILTKIKIKGEIIFSNNQEFKDSHRPDLSSWNHLEFCEIQLLTTNEKISEKNMIYYCLYHEIFFKKDAFNALSRESIQLGDKIEFFPSPVHAVALYPSLVLKVTIAYPSEYY